MTLSDLKNYLSQHQRATLTDLVNHFRSEPQTLQPMLEHWQRKGKVRHTQLQACSKGCCRGTAGMDLYEWLDGKTHPMIQIVANTGCSSKSS